MRLTRVYDDKRFRRNFLSACIAIIHITTDGWWSLAIFLHSCSQMSLRFAYVGLVWINQTLKFVKALRLKSKDSVLWLHCVGEHDGANVQFKMKTTGYFADPLTRQVEEAVRIFHTSNPINRKGEWKKTAIPRATYVKEWTLTMRDLSTVLKMSVAIMSLLFLSLCFIILVNFTIVLQTSTLLLGYLQWYWFEIHHV